MVIQEVKNRHRDMMAAFVYDGLNQREVSVKFGISESRLSILRRSPLWAIEEREMRTLFINDKIKRIESLTTKAIDTLERNLDCLNPNAEISAAKELLNRGGIPASVVIETLNPSGSEVMYETLKDIQEEKKRLLEELGVSSVEELLPLDNPAGTEAHG